MVILVYFWQFGIFCCVGIIFSFWVCCTKKNLANKGRCFCKITLHVITRAGICSLVERSCWKIVTCKCFAQLDHTKYFTAHKRGGFFAVLKLNHFHFEGRVSSVFYGWASPNINIALNQTRVLIMSISSLK
jgi:hypothetical protein